MASINNDMKILNDSINKMPTMVTVNQGQAIANSSSRSSNVQQKSAAKNALAQAGNAMMGAPDSSRN